MLRKKLREKNFNKKKQIHESYLVKESLDSKKNEIYNIQNNQSQYTPETDESNELEITNEIEQVSEEQLEEKVQEEITDEIEEIKEEVKEIEEIKENKNTNKKK